AEQYQAEQRVLASTTARDIVTLLLALFALDDPDGSWGALKMALKAIVRDRRSQSARLTGPYYQRIRAEAGVRGEVEPAQPRELVERRLDEALDGAGMFVYRSAVTAGDVRYGGEKYHDHDGCQAVPIFDPQSPILDRADDLYQQWREVTAGHSGAEARKVWRRYWEGRDTEGDAGESA